MEHRIIFATSNQGKMREIREILKGLGTEILSMKEAGVQADIVEDGDTFEACQCRRRPVPAVSAVELQDPPPEPQPSLILRRMAEGETLWDIAKQYRTDQDAIRSANELTEEARPEGMLLIPRVR